MLSLLLAAAAIAPPSAVPLVVEDAARSDRVSLVDPRTLRRVGAVRVAGPETLVTVGPDGTGLAIVSTTTDGAARPVLDVAVVDAASARLQQRVRVPFAGPLFDPLVGGDRQDHADLAGARWTAAGRIVAAASAPGTGVAIAVDPDAGTHTAVALPGLPLDATRAGDGLFVVAEGDGRRLMAVALDGTGAAGAPVALERRALQLDVASPRDARLPYELLPTTAPGVAWLDDDEDRDLLRVDATTGARTTVRLPRRRTTPLAVDETQILFATSRTPASSVDRVHRLTLADGRLRRAPALDGRLACASGGLVLRRLAGGRVAARAYDGRRLWTHRIPGLDPLEGITVEGGRVYAANRVRSATTGRVVGGPWRGLLAPVLGAEGGGCDFAFSADR